MPICPNVKSCKRNTIKGTTSFMVCSQLCKVLFKNNSIFQELLKKEKQMNRFVRKSENLYLMKNQIWKNLLLIEALHLKNINKKFQK